MQCNGCNDEVNMVHRHPDGQRFCADCWRKYMPKEEEKLTFNVCVACRTIGNVGAWVDAQTFVCDLCAEDPNNGATGGSNKPAVTLPPIETGYDERHIALKLKGNAKAIAFFHYAISTIDSDWPWSKADAKHEVCRQCGGVSYINPLVDCDDIKILAKACGVGKCKIKYWGEACLQQ